MLKPGMTPVKHQSGFTLIEVLISMVIVSIGVLGLAGIQLTGLRNNQSSFFRTQATQLAYDITDRMRANPPGLDNGDYNNQAATADDCEANVCTSAQMAGYDLAQWNQAIQALPLGAGTVCVDSTPATAACDDTGESYVIRVSWDDGRTGAANQQFLMSFEP